MVADLCHVVLSCFRGEKAPRKNPPNGDFFVFSHGDLSPRHTKVCRTLFMFRLFAFCLSYLCLAGRKVATRKHENHHVARRKYDTFISGEFSPSICRVFAWRGERSPRENTPRLKCRDFVFHFRIFALSHGGSVGENTKKVTFRVFDLSPSGAHGRFKIYTIRSKDDSTQENSTQHSRFLTSILRFQHCITNEYHTF